MSKLANGIGLFGCMRYTPWRWHGGTFRVCAHICVLDLMGGLTRILRMRRFRCAHPSERWEWRWMIMRIRVPQMRGSESWIQAPLAARPLIIMDRTYEHCDPVAPFVAKPLPHYYFFQKNIRTIWICWVVWSRHRTGAPEITLKKVWKSFSFCLK